MSTWWNELVDTLTSGAWTASLLQGIITGAVAIIAAFLILKRQLLADRELVEEDRVAAQKSARQEKSASAAESIGRILVQISRSSDNFSNSDLGERLRRTSEPLSLDLVGEVRFEALAYFPSFDQHIAMARLKECDVLWRIGSKVIASNASLSDEAIGFAMRKALSPAQDDLHAIGKQLMRWSGENELPNCLDVVTSERPLVIQDKTVGEIRDRWKEDAAQIMQRNALIKMGKSPSAGLDS